jgi:hypothetical protein
MAKPEYPLVRAAGHGTRQGVGLAVALEAAGGARASRQATAVPAEPWGACRSLVGLHIYDFRKMETIVFEEFACKYQFLCYFLTLVFSWRLRYGFS